MWQQTKEGSNIKINIIPMPVDEKCIIWTIIDILTLDIEIKTQK